MRAAILLAVLLAGCALPGPAPGPPASPAVPALPGTPPANATWTEAPFEERPALLSPDGGLLDDAAWRVRWTPGNLTGLAGDVARVRVEVFPPATGTRAWLHLSQWTRDANDSLEVEVPPEGAAFDVDVLMGPSPTVGAYLRVDTSPECCLYGNLVGPALGLLPSGEPARALAHDDASPLAPGLHVERSGTAARVTWVYRTTGAFDCSETARAVGTPVLRNGTLHVFVASASSDACMGEAAPRTPRVVVETPPLPPGGIEVLVHVTEGCFCQLQPWRTERVSVPADA